MRAVVCLYASIYIIYRALCAIVSQPGSGERGTPPIFSRFPQSGAECFEVVALATPLRETATPGVGFPATGSGTSVPKGDEFLEKFLEEYNQGCGIQLQ